MNRALFALAVLSGCGGDKDSDTGAEDTATNPASEATFTRVKAEILPTCAVVGCHAAGTSINGMELVEGEEHAALVNAASIGNPGQTLVIPGDADGSYVVHKLEDAIDIVGGAMPPPFGGLPPAEITLMRDWIDAGALDN